MQNCMSTLAQSITQAATDMALGRPNKSLFYFANVRFPCWSPWCMHQSSIYCFFLLVYESLVTGYRYYLFLQFNTCISWFFLDVCLFLYFKKCLLSCYISLLSLDSNLVLHLLQTVLYLIYSTVSALTHNSSHVNPQNIDYLTLLSLVLPMQGFGTLQGLCSGELNPTPTPPAFSSTNQQQRGRQTRQLSGGAV